MSRLIDADALAARYMSAPPDYYHTTQIVGEITSAPTVKMQGWISVKDRLPKSIINKVLVWLEHDDLVGYIGFGHYEKYKGQEIWFDLEHSEAFSVRGYTVTHWMPLPEPPEEVTGDG